MININILEKIKKDNKNIIGDDFVFETLNVGFTNDVFSINNKYILKICKDKENESKFNNEIEFYLKNKNNKYLPRLLSFHKSVDINDASYLIIEKLTGKSLYYVWHTFNIDKKKQIIKDLAEMMKSFHSIKGKSADWNIYITDKIKKNLDICHKENILNEQYYIKGINILSKAEKYLTSTDFSLVHADIHFDNLIYTDEEQLKIIDFETSISAPIDYELDIFLRMCNKPLKYASEETEKFVKKEDYQDIEKWFKEYYPKIFSHQYYNIRMKYYDLEANIRLLPRFREDSELKQIVVNIINEIEEINS